MKFHVHGVKFNQFCRLNQTAAWLLFVFNSLICSSIMLERYCCLVLLGFLLASCSSVPPTGKPSSPETGRSALDKLHSQIDSVFADSALSPCFVGAKIVSLTDGRVLYERNANKLFHPASNMKLLTTAAALKILGKDFKFRTVLGADSVIRRGELRGSLYVKGSGDPLTTISDIDSLVSSVRSHGIEKVRGGIVGNTSYFDTLYWGAGWMWDDEPDPDEAFISALSVNDNAIEVSVGPGRRIGDAVEATLNPATSFMKVLNSGVTSRDTLIPHIKVTRRRGENTILIEGRMDPHAAKEQFTLSVWRPELYFLNLLKERLAEAGVKVRGAVRLDTLAGTLTLAMLSHPIDSVLHKVNKPSDNLAAESLLKAIAAERGGERGSSTVGLSLVESCLAAIGVDTTNMMLYDGSGVSWYNAISPDAMAQLLVKMSRDTDLFKDFYGSLPVAGVDGTLKSRMKGTSAEGNVHAKTGSLTGVSSLSGYATSADGRPLAFSILCNHFPSKLSVLRDMQDKIMELLTGSRLNIR